MKLDDRLGPALPLSPDASEKLIESALDQAYAKKKRRTLPVAAGVAIGLLVPAIAAAVIVAVWPEEPIEPPPLPEIVKAPQVKVEEPPPPERPKPKKKKRAEDLLAKANALRRESKWREAEAVYLEVVERFPRSGSAYVALVAAASLRLDHLQDPRGALALLSKAEKKTGPLGAEILWNQSRAHRSLGDPERERSALERMLAEHPEAAFREAAQDRLRELQ